VEDYYTYVDRTLGMCVAAASRDATVVVLSDHGMHAKSPPSRLRSGVEISGDHEDAPDGILLVSGTGIKKNYRLRRPGMVLSHLYGDRLRADVYDVAPTLLYLLGLPVAQDMDGEVITEMFTDDYLATHQINFVRSFEDTDGTKSQNRKAIPTPRDEELKDV